MSTEPVISQPVTLVDADGKLNRSAIGWMRQPLVDASGVASSRKWGKNKRWEYWNVVTPTHILSLTVSALDYATLSEVWVFDRRSMRQWGQSAISPLGRVTLPDNLESGPVRAQGRNLAIAVDETPVGTRLRARIDEVAFDVMVTRPPLHERLGVVIPWSREQFQYTVKDVGRPAHGWVEVNSVRMPVPAGQSWAVLDHGRGRWPREISWNWAAASGEVDGWQALFNAPYLEAHPQARTERHVLGLQFGAEWTKGTGLTENALYFDGQLHKIGEEINFEFDSTNWLSPWRITGPDVDLTFEPFYNKHSHTNLGIIRNQSNQCFGTYKGMVSIPRVGMIMVTDLVGFAEDVHNRW